MNSDCYIYSDKASWSEFADRASDFEETGRAPELQYTVTLARLGWVMAQLEVVIEAGLDYFRAGSKRRAMPKSAALEQRVQMLEALVKARFTAEDYPAEFAENLENADEAARLYAEWTRKYREGLSSVSLSMLANLGLSAVHCRSELVSAIEQFLPDCPKIAVPPAIEWEDAGEQLELFCKSN